MAIDPRSRRGAFQPTPRSAGLTPDSGDDPVAGSTAAEMSARRFGGRTRTQESSFTLTTTPQVIIGGNPRRVFWSMFNRGIVTAAVSTDASMTFANGIPMGAAGGFVQSDVTEDGDTVGWPVFGACESGTCVLRVIETMRV